MGKDSFPGSEISIELVGRQSQWVGNSLRFPQSNSVLLLTHSGSKHAESHAAMCLCGLRSSFAMASYGFDWLLWTACYFKNFLRLSCSNFRLRTWRINYGKSTSVGNFSHMFRRMPNQQCQSNNRRTSRLYCCVLFTRLVIAIRCHARLLPTWCPWSYWLAHWPRMPWWLGSRIFVVVMNSSNQRLQIQPSVQQYQ